MRRRQVRGWRWLQGLAAACLLALLAAPAQAQVAAGYSEYYIPGSEDTLSLAMRSLGPLPASLNTHALIAITSWSDNIIVYYDHWEDGIDFDPDNPETTYDEKFTMPTTGTLLSLDDTPVGGIPIPRDSASTYYDGGDRMYVVGGAVTVTRVSWRDNPGRSIQAAAWEIYPVKPQLTTYVLPFGENLAGAPNNFTDFIRTFVIVQATADNTSFTVDLDGNGTADALDQNFDGDTADAGDTATVTLQAGESFFVGNVAVNPVPLPRGARATINSNAVIQGSSTLQVKFIIGDPAANYETRGLSAFPRGYWTKDYYAPVGEPANGTVTDIFLYNPNAAPITIAYETAAATGTFAVGAGQTVSYRAAVGALPTGGGVYLRGSDAFWGVSTIDSTGQVNEWAYSLLPSTLLYQEHFLGWAPGGADGNDSGVFLAAVQDNTRVFVDTDNDGTADQTYTLDRLQTQYITDADGDLSGARFWATGLFTMSFGQNPDTAPPQATSGDLGYVAIPGTDFISLVLTADKSVSPQVVPTASGSTAAFTLTVNSQKYDVDALSVVDTLPPNWAFVNDSAVITLPDRSTVSGAAANPTVAGGTLTWPATLLGDMAENQEILITFTAQTTAALADGTLSQNRVRATGTRTVGGQTQTFNATDFAYVASGSLGITKTSTAPDPAYPGDPFGYTVTVANPAGGATQTGISLYDAIPAGLSYVPASGSVTCPLPGNVRDEFAAAAYDNDDGTAVWSADWAETDSLGGGATGGLVSATGGQLRFMLAQNVRDEFAAAAYGNNDGSASWSGTWTETDTNGNLAAGAAGGFVRVAGGALQLRYLASTYGDNFNTQAYANQTGSALWSADWVETNDDGSATITGNRHIAVTGNTLFFDRAVTAGGVNMGISRTADLSGADAVTIQFTPTDNGFDAGEAVVANYYVDGVGPTLLGTFDGGAGGWSGNQQTYNIAFAGSVLRLEFISTGNWNSNGDEMSIDNVLITANRPAAGVPAGTGAEVRRAANLGGAASATLSFGFTQANLEAGDALVVEASADGTSFTVLETFTSATANGSRSYDLKAPTDYTSATTTIRFRVTGGYDDTNEAFNADNVDIAFAGADARAQRAADLSGATAATLTFTLANAGLEAGDTFVVEASADGTSFTVLDTFTSATGAGAKSYDLKAPTDYTSATTAVRLRVTGGFDQVDESFSADDVDIAFVRTDTFAAADPPGFLASAAGCVLLAGESLTLTFDVTVDNPLPSGIATAVNTAAVTTATYPIQLTASVTDTLANPSALSASAAGRVWLDDGDGAQEIGEPGIANVEVALKDLFGTPVATTVTDANGRYIFTGVAPGAGYYVEATDGLLAGTSQTYPIGRTDDRTDGFDLAAGEERTGVDLGYAPSAGTATFGDLAWVDADGDAFRDAGEVGLGGVGISLWQDVATTDGPADGILDAECTAPVTVPDDCDTLAATTTTAPDGSYLFTGVPAGGSETYFIAAAGPPGYNATGNGSHRFFATAPGAYLTADFGFQGDPDDPVNPVTTYTISDRVWLDGNGDGVFDAGESGIAGVTIELLDASLNVIGTTATAADGTFTFSGVAGGGADYTVRVNDTTGALVDTHGTTAYALARERIVENLTGDVDRRNDVADPALDPSFGFAVSRSIGDTVFNDSSGAAGDNVQQAGELGIAGVLVSLYRDVNGDGLLDGGDALVGSVATDAFGRYLFSGLTDDDYVVSVTAPAGYGYSGTDGDPAAGVQRTATIAGGGSDLTADFGFRAPVQRTLAGTLWEDDDGDGVIDAEEPGRLAGVTVDVYDGPDFIITITTDAAGQYVVPGLLDKAYTVRVTDTAGMLNGFSATVPATAELTADLTAGDVGDADFGFRLPPPTRVFLAGFRALAAPQGVTVEWETTTEVGTVGYRVLRLEGERAVPVNERIVPAFLESRAGGRYALADPAAAGSPLTYLLLEVRRSGAPLPYGPFTVTPEPAGTPPRPLLAAGTPAAAEPLTVPEGRRYARALRRPAAARPAEAGAPAAVSPLLAAVGTKVRIAVTSDGLYRLFASEIAALLGKRPEKIAARIAEGTLRLSRRGVSVAYLPRNGGANLIFHGTGLDTNFTGENVYWLEIAAGRRMRRAAIAPAKIATRERHFPERIHAEEDELPDFWSAADPNADYWRWKWLLAGDPDYEAVVLPLEVPAPAGAGLPATLTVRLVGGNRTPAGTGHRAVILLNDTPVGEASWSGLATHDATCVFDQGLLLPGGNAVGVRALLDPGVPESFVYVESLDLDYRRRYLAADNRLLLRGGGNGALTVSGFTDRSILLFDLTNPDRPALMTGAAVAGTEGNYSISFKPATPATPYLAAARSAISAPDAATAWSPAGLADPANAAEYLVITGEPLLEAAGALADRRAAQGLSTKVVTVRAIMDEFNAGIFDPAAIRAFLAAAHAAWAVPPRYVLLAGDGSYDYRDRFDDPGTDTPIVPPAFVPTPYGLAASDGWFADVDGDRVPEAAVGRLPALSNAGLQGLVDKVAAFEDAAAGDWDAALLFAADDADFAGDYPDDSDRLIDALPAGLTATRDYVGDAPIADARTSFRNAVNAGVAHVNYFGHGGYDLLADEGLVRLASEVPALVNGERLPLFSLFTCVVGDFTDPYLANLGEALLLREGGGASAVLAPSGDAVHAGSARLAGALFTNRYGGGAGPRLGDAVVGAMSAYALQPGGADFTLDVYNLLGDPGLLLR